MDKFEYMMQLADKIKNDGAGLPMIWQDVLRLRVDMHVKAIREQADKPNHDHGTDSPS